MGNGLFCQRCVSILIRCWRGKRRHGLQADSSIVWRSFMEPSHTPSGGPGTGRPWAAPSDAVARSGRGSVDHAEIAKFEAMADAWWDPTGKFKPLHRLN